MKKIDRILLLTDFKAKKASKSELENMIDVCKKFAVEDSLLQIEKFGYDTLSQLHFALDFCNRKKEDLLIISSPTHYLRVVWIAYRINKKYNIKIRHSIGWGIPRIHDFLYDIVLIFVYPIIDLLGYSDEFSHAIKKRRESGYL